MAQCRWQNQSKAAEFWEDPPNTENFCCTQNGLLDFYIYEKGFIWCPSESRLWPVSPKRSNCVLHSSKVYLHAHLAFQARYFMWAWNYFKWTMAAFFKTVYLREQTVEWLKVWTLPPRDEEKQSPALRNGISSPASKMLGCRLLAHCGTRRTIVL